jgi:SAM-dependent methyltransferase
VTAAPHSPGTQRPEEFQPIAVESPAAHPFLFALRCAVDLQLRTIARELRPAMARLSGQVLDVGAGQSPWRAWLPSTATYQGIDVGFAHAFGMDGGRSDIVYYDGRIMPFGDELFDCALCIEVLEHSEDPELLVAEMARVVRPGGTLLLTVPWSARQHHLPHDYHRFSRGRLETLLHRHGFTGLDIRERGNDVAVIANKLTVLAIGLLRPPPLRKLLHTAWRVPLGVLCGTLASGFILAAHLSMAMGLGSRDDPLGYFVRGTRTAV